MRNLLRRGRIWYFKKMVNGRIKPVSLATDDLELAKAKRNGMEQTALNEQWALIKGPRALRSGTLADIFKKYDEVGGLPLRTLGAVKSSMLTLTRVALGNAKLEPQDVGLDVLTTKLVRDYQDKLRKRYEADAGSDEKARRMARDRADRTSKSTFNQAKSIFCRRRDLIARYREAGIEMPESVEQFATAGSVGKFSTKIYFPPSDAILANTFQQVEELQKVDEDAYFLFWVALATGARRNELADMKCEDLVERDGRLWVGAGLGKDGHQMQIPVIDWQVHPANGRTPEQVLRALVGNRKAGFLFTGSFTQRYDELPDRLNAWMTRLGWADEKKLHALRAFIGCKLYVENQRLAQLYLRHKSIATTEKFYGHFLGLLGAFAFPKRMPVPAPPPAQLAIVQTSGRVATN